MRIDKFLWTIRLFKTRTLATEQCKEGRVTLNSEAAKPARELKPGDIISIRKGAVTFSWRVIAFPKSRVAAKLVSEFATDITSPEELAKWELIKLAAEDNRPRGLGRPTKRERRTMDSYFDQDDEN